MCALLQMTTMNYEAIQFLKADVRDGIAFWRASNGQVCTSTVKQLDRLNQALLVSDLGVVGYEVQNLHAASDAAIAMLAKSANDAAKALHGMQTAMRNFARDAALRMLRGQESDPQIASRIAHVMSPESAAAFGVRSADGGFKVAVHVQAGDLTTVEWVRAETLAEAAEVIALGLSDLGEREVFATAESAWLLGDDRVRVIPLGSRAETTEGRAP